MTEDDEHRHRHREPSVFHVIGPVIAGVILILVGLSALFGWDIWKYLWPIIIIIIGLAIIIGAVLRTRNRYEY